MTYLQFTLRIPAANRPAEVEIYLRYKAPFLETIKDAKSKELLLRDEDVQVLHGFDTVENTKGYLQSALFKRDVVGGLQPLLDAAPDIRIYEAA